MAKPTFNSPVLPDINRQIEFIKNLRKNVVPCMNHFQSEPEMIFAIEQSLLAAKTFGESNGDRKKAEQDLDKIFNSPDYSKSAQILNSLGIKMTLTRVEILRIILSKRGREFTILEIYNSISKKIMISKSVVKSTVILFQIRGLIFQKTKQFQGRTKNIGRPETKFIYRDRDREKE